MPEIGHLFSSGQWLVKPVQQPSSYRPGYFRPVDWTKPTWSWIGQPSPRHGKLKKFLSFGPWDSEEGVQQWRQKPEFQTFLSTARELCDDIQTRTLPWSLSHVEKLNGAPKATEPKVLGA